MSQCSVSFNAKRGTLRGLHFQASPHDEEKLVRCTGGAMFDVIVDLRTDSPTHRGWFGVELTAANRRALYVPKGFAHGFISLADDTEVYYMISVPYAAGFARGLRWNDPALGIRWPMEPVVISERDADYALLDAPAGA
jgi:dTDP-4-dehydrorhamnose 3,5-epimerase